MFKTTFNTIIITALIICYPVSYNFLISVPLYYKPRTKWLQYKCSYIVSIYNVERDIQWPIYLKINKAGGAPEATFFEWVIFFNKLPYCCWFLMGPITVKAWGSQKCRSTTGYVSNVFNFRTNLKAPHPPLI